MSLDINQVNFRFKELVKEARENQTISTQNILVFKKFMKELIVEKNYSFWENVINPREIEKEESNQPEVIELLDKLREIRHAKIELHNDEAAYNGIYKLKIKEDLLLKKLSAHFVSNNNYFDIEDENIVVFYYFSGFELADAVLSQAIIEGNSAFDKKHLDFLLQPVKI